jgi:crotonobetainyl-CoA:carnitine CoA-transferase CaiB-like acyl-CoA transferase
MRLAVIRDESVAVAPAAAIPALGQHTDSILFELGYSSDEIAQLRGDAAV